MKHSESLDAIAPALVSAQGEWAVVAKANAAEVQSRTGRGFSYHYASLPDVQAMCRPILARHGLAVVQGTESEDEAGAAVVTTVLHVSGQWISARARVPIAVATAQAAGSAISYGRRIGLIAALGIPTDDADDDGAAASDATVTVQQRGAIPSKAAPAASKPAGKPSAKAPAEALGAIPDACTSCGGPIWDNRLDKRNPKAPDWKCRDKSCVDERGFVTGGWCEAAPLGAPDDVPPIDDESPFDSSDDIRDY